MKLLVDQLRAAHDHEEGGRRGKGRARGVRHEGLLHVRVRVFALRSAKSFYIVDAAALLLKLSHNTNTLHTLITILDGLLTTCFTSPSRILLIEAHNINRRQTDVMPESIPIYRWRCCKCSNDNNWTLAKSCVGHCGHPVEGCVSCVVYIWNGEYSGYDT
jgi:hypothetical protein